MGLLSKIKQMNLKAYLRVTTVIVVVLFLVFALVTMLRWNPERFSNGTWDLTQESGYQQKPVSLSGKWEFYFGQLLVSDDFKTGKPLANIDYVKVPGSWDEHASDYSNQGVATYRMVIQYPEAIKDPALRVSNVSTAYKLFVNGQLLTSVGTIKGIDSENSEGAQVIIVALPTDTQTAEIIVQVSNQNYARGGLRESPIFGSKVELEKNRSSHLAFQLLFIGGVLFFGAHYLILFIIQRKDWASLVFSLICFVTGIRSFIWGEVPLFIYFPEVKYSTLAYINYVTGYNIIPLVVIFVALMYQSDYKKRSLIVVLIPTLFFNALLLTSTVVMSHFTGYLYLLIIVQLIFVLIILVRAILFNRENALLMFLTISVYFLTINHDILHYNGIGGINASNMFLYGNITVILSLSFVQARQHAKAHEKLILYNENLIEANRLKDKIMETEMSFLQAQIKPHFLYNALNAIANVSEKNGQEGGKLIVDLAIYLRESLAFNNLEKRISLEKELEFVDKYFNIEQARFGQKITLVKNVNCPLNFQIPILILQPLVENAVQHGISKKMGGGIVTLNIHETESETVFEIVDDGIGIKPEILTTLLAENRPERSIGLLNINSRLKRIYGCHLEITSDVNLGTRVKFTILKSIDNGFIKAQSEFEGSI